MTAQFCAAAAWNDIGDVDALDCTDKGQATIGTGGSGGFSAKAATYTVPATGVPSGGVVVKVTGTDKHDNAATAVVRVIHAAGLISVTALTDEQRGTLVSGGAGGTHDFTPTGSRWLVKPALILCRIPQSADPSQTAVALRQIVGNSFQNFCSTKTTVAFAGVEVADDGTWANDADSMPYTVTYTVPDGGVPPYGVALSAGDLNRFQGQAVAVIPPAASAALPSLSVAAADRTSLTAGNTHAFAVSGSGWTAGGEVAFAFLNAGWPQGPVKRQLLHLHRSGLHLLGAPQEDRRQRQRVVDLGGHRVEQRHHRLPHGDRAGCGHRL